jgi:DNA polymerase III subunit delta'
MTQILESQLYPWLSQAFSEITRNPISHSLLIYGEKDLGKLQFGLELAKFLLCESTTHKPCGQCQACHWVGQGNHPDLFVIVPQNLKSLLPFEIEDTGDEDGEEKKLSKVIRIEQIRQMISRNELGSYRGGKRVVLIYPIESMQQEAANSLLKTLEEPSDNLHFIIITHQLERILPTIRSRCHLFPINKPSKEHAIVWLQTQLPETIHLEEISQRLTLKAGSPLRVLQTHQEKMLDEQLLVNELAKFNQINSSLIIDFLSHHTILEILNCILKWSIDIDLVSFHLPARYFPQYQAKIESAVHELNRVHFQQFLSALKDDLRMANHPLFPKIQLDALLTRYKQLF